MTARRVTVVLAALIVAVVAVLPALRSGAAGPDGPEAGFARDMSTHHAQAVRMALTVRDRTRDTAVRTLAYDIATTQSQQIGMMTAWLDRWGAPKTDPRGPMRWMSHEGHAGRAAGAQAMPGMATPAQLAALERASGRDAEVLFLRLMIVHHRAGVEMARAVLVRTGDEQVQRLARTMVRGQQAEIALMTDMLRQRGA
ncbi:hypothetical protein BTM25_43870 [Actinomadura rubteroloni]|uniref:DUF305 domain-containing protein n=1 Tax=Actinomadura rubteroloni TaxID=1926885 RepID=A0A2P4UDU8_9ACTN|nr:DUF305 domain-containing protein [Actinomadura rubteroloni]POM23234.1 hypothetical protein BTM25_43870 [Actinomadura rubteroloni]